VHLDDGRALEIKVENEGKQDKDANHDPCEDNYIADEDVKGVDEDPGIYGNLWFDHSRFCKSVRSAKTTAQEPNKARKLTNVRTKKAHLVKIVVEYVVDSVEILGKDVESLTDRCEIEKSHRGTHHRCEG
jgi:hypothetical protein